MNVRVRMMVLLGGACFAVQALALAAGPRPPSSRRVLLACMTKQMTVSRTISYNEATAVCKAQLKARDPALASSGQTKPLNGLGR
jgi:hypothetical protein